MIATRSAPNIAVQIVGRRKRWESGRGKDLRRTARHRFGKLHRGRRLHLHGMYGARRKRDLLYIPRIRLSIAAVGLTARLGKPRMRGALFSPSAHSQRGRERRRLRIGAARFEGGRLNGGQLVFGFVAGRAGSRIRYTVY
jgi:hypothetical protein